MVLIGGICGDQPMWPMQMLLEPCRHILGALLDDLTRQMDGWQTVANGEQFHHAGASLPAAWCAGVFRVCERYTIDTVYAVERLSPKLGKGRRNERGGGA
jgi:hypothetical protein